MSRQHKNAARSRSRRVAARDAIRNAQGAWVDLPMLGAIDLLAMRDDPAIEIELVAGADGFYTPRGRHNPDRADEYARLLANFRAALAAPKRCAQDVEAVNEASGALSRFSEPRRVG